MLPLRISGATRRLAEDQDEYFALSIRDEMYSGRAFMSSLWEPTLREVEALAAGGALYCGFALGDGSRRPAALKKPTEEELDILSNGGRVLLTIAGNRHPPVCMCVAQAEELNTISYPDRVLALLAVKPFEASIA